MVSTPIQRTSVKSNFRYHSGINFIYREDNRWFQDQLHLLNRPDRPLGKSLKIISPITKVLVSLNMGMFHFWYDSAGPLLKLLDENKNLEVNVKVKFDSISRDFFLKEKFSF